jgi:hypothetical protein
MIYRRGVILILIKHCYHPKVESCHSIGLNIKRRFCSNVGFATCKLDVCNSYCMEWCHFHDFPSCDVLF